MSNERPSKTIAFKGSSVSFSVALFLLTACAGVPGDGTAALTNRFRGPVREPPREVSQLHSGVDNAFIVTNDQIRFDTEKVHVALPTEANGWFTVRDGLTATSVSVALTGLSSVSPTIKDNVVMYGKAFDGADVIHRTTEDGTEDWVYFETPPVVPQLSYRLRLDEGVAGLRLIHGVLEMLSADGTPRLRMSAPSLIDSLGQRLPADVKLEGCRADSDSRGPWRRPVTPPDASECSVLISWEPGVSYPLWVDPVWSSTSSLLYDHVGQPALALEDGTAIVIGSAGIWGPACELYDAESKTWSVTGPMLTTHVWPTATRLSDGRVLVVGGTDGTFQQKPLATAELFNPLTGTWSSTGSLSNGRYQHAMTLVGNDRVVVVGGAATIDGPESEVYDAATGSWTATADTVVRRKSAHTVTPLANGRVLVAGGFDTANATLLDCEEYDPVQNTWAVVGSMLGVRAVHTATRLSNGTVLVVGGQSSGVQKLATTEIYNPSAGTWSAGPSIHVARGSHTTIELAGHNVLIVGGHDGSSALSSAEIFDVQTSQWSLASPMAHSRWVFPATLLHNHQVLVVGGWGDVGASKSAELFGPQDAGFQCSTISECLSGVCTNGVCVSCASDADCIAGTYCASNGNCAVTKQLGESCNAGAGGDCLELNCGVCGDATCVNNVCYGHCVADSDCPSDQYCAKSGVCQPRKTQGATCNLNAGVECAQADCRLCASSFCADGFCCDKACDGSCEACAQASGASANGTCTVRPQGNVGSPNCGNYLCDGQSGQCPTECQTSNDCAGAAICTGMQCSTLGEIGDPCASAEDCENNTCVDGYCCNDVCGDPCEACDSPGHEGSCVAIEGKPHGDRAPCVDNGDACFGRCNGSVTTSCFYPAQGTECEPAACLGDVLQPHAVCDGSGICASTSTETCAPYTCDEAAKGCKQECTTSQDCAAGAVCDTGTNKCAPAKGICADSFTLTQPNGQSVSCSPYLCVASACQQQCAKDSECADGFHCIDFACSATGGAGGTGAAGASANTGGTESGGNSPGVTSSEDNGGCSLSKGANSNTGNSWGAWLAGIATCVVGMRVRKRSRRRSMPGSNPCAQGMGAPCS